MPDDSASEQNRVIRRALREECSRSGVRISLINPGAVRTGFYRDAPFRPGPSADNALEPEDVAKAVCGVLGSRPGVVFDEVNLSPLKRVLLMYWHQIPFHQQIAKYKQDLRRYCQSF